MAKNLIISGIVEKKRHSFRISVSDSLYKAIKNHAVERNFTTAEAAEDMLEESVLKLPIIYDLYADEETNTINNIKYYLEEIKKNVKDSVLMVHDESYGHVAEDFISFLEPLSSNPMSCFNSGNLARIEKECTAMLLAAYDAAIKAKLVVFPLYESYFYELLHCCKNNGRYLMNKDSITGFEDFLKSAIEGCILIEKYQGYFVRNIFRAAPAFNSSFNENENQFLLCLSDNLHNVPELAELFIKTAKMLEDCESEEEISKLIKSTKENFLLKFVTERLQETIGIIRNKEERNSLGIKDNNHILSWCFELNALSSSCEIFYTQLEEFIQTRG